MWLLPFLCFVCCSWPGPMMSQSLIFTNMSVSHIHGDNLSPKSAPDSWFSKTHLLSQLELNLHLFYFTMVEEPKISYTCFNWTPYMNSILRLYLFLLKSKDTGSQAGKPRERWSETKIPSKLFPISQQDQQFISLHVKRD